MPNNILKDYPLILDGAMGTELLKREVKLPLPLWSAVANETHPEFVYNIHLDYVKAGANVITTNTFRSTPFSYLKTGISKKDAFAKAESNLRKAVKLSQKACSKAHIIAGSIAPLEDCYTPKTFLSETEFDESTTFVLRWLQEEKVDVILFETMGNYHEILCTISLIEKCTIPVWFSLILKDENYLLDQTPLKNVLTKLKMSEVELLLFNCNTIHLTLKAVEVVKQYWDKPWGVYPNLGLSNPEIDGTMNKILTTGEWRKFIKKVLKEKPSVIGGCCGSTPEYTKILNHMVHRRIVE